MTRFERVTPRLPVADLVRTLGFYRDLLGFEVVVSWPGDAPTFLILERDAVRLGFFDDEGGSAVPGRAPELYLRVTDARALHGRLDGRVEIEWGPEVYAYGRREFAVRDPDGYLVIFTEPTDDPPTTAEPE